MRHSLSGIPYTGGRRSGAYAFVMRIYPVCFQNVAETPFSLNRIW